MVTMMKILMTTSTMLLLLFAWCWSLFPVGTYWY
jgi:hypothetical protein